MSLPQPHFSFAQYSLYCQSPEDYFKRYILGVIEEPTTPMILGSIFHKAAENLASKWKDELVASGFTPNYTRGIEKAVLSLPHPARKEIKLEVFYPKFNVNLLGYVDGMDTKYIYEWKTGASWNQQRVNESEQITMYALIHRLAFGKTPRFILAHINLPNGKVSLFQTKRTVKQIEQFRKEKLEPVMQLINRGVFHHI